MSATKIGLGFQGYFDHPLGENNGDGIVKRQDNIENAGRWIRFFADTTRITIMAPWWAWTTAHGETHEYEKRRQVDSRFAIERCDVLIQSAWHSPHMKLLADHAKRIGLPILDLTSYGHGPPDRTDEDAVQVILARLKRVLSAKPRRVWMPPLAEEQVGDLIKLSHATAMHLPGEHDEALETVNTIIARAIDTGV